MELGLGFGLPNPNPSPNQREADGLRELVLVRGLPPLRAARALAPLLLGGVGHLEVARLAQLRRVGAVVVERGVEAAEGRLPPPRPGAEPRLVRVRARARVRVRVRLRARV